MFAKSNAFSLTKPFTDVSICLLDLAALLLVVANDFVAVPNNATCVAVVVKEVPILTAPEVTTLNLLFNPPNDPEANDLILLPKLVNMLLDLVPSVLSLVVESTNFWNVCLAVSDILVFKFLNLLPASDALDLTVSNLDDSVPNTPVLIPFILFFILLNPLDTAGHLLFNVVMDLVNVSIVLLDTLLNTFFTLDKLLDTVEAPLLIVVRALFTDSIDLAFKLFNTFCKDCNVF